MAGHMVLVGDDRNVYMVLVVKAEVKRPLGRPKRKWEENIKIEPKEIRHKGVEWIDLAQDRDRQCFLVNSVMNHRVP